MAEFVEFSITDPKPSKKKKIELRVVYRGEEQWRTSVPLGSMLCSTKEIKYRCLLSDIGFKKFEKIWLNKPKISLSVTRKIRIYETQVVSIILYNCNSWAAP